MYKYIFNQIKMCTYVDKKKRANGPKAKVNLGEQTQGES